MEKRKQRKTSTAKEKDERKAERNERKLRETRRDFHTTTGKNIGDKENQQRGRRNVDCRLNEKKKAGREKHQIAKRKTDEEKKQKTSKAKEKQERKLRENRSKTETREV